MFEILQLTVTTTIDIRVTFISTEVKHGHCEDKKSAMEVGFHNTLFFIITNPKCMGISATAKKKSYIEFILSGRNTTIKSKVVRFLIKNPARAYTAAELQIHLSISHRSSLCHPLQSLVDNGCIRVIAQVYDSNTNREVGAYQIVNQ